MINLEKCIEELIKKLTWNKVMDKVQGPVRMQKGLLLNKLIS